MNTQQQASTIERAEMESQAGEFNLVDGTFTTAYTREILQTLFRDKITFHSRRNFSHEERFGKPDLHAQVRIPVLRQTLEEALQYLQLHENDGSFEIYADIRIKPVKF